MLDLGKKYLIYHTPGHWRLGAISETTSSDFCGKQSSTAVRLNYISPTNCKLNFQTFLKIKKHENI
jgi:hypothetical protein